MTVLSDITGWREEKRCLQNSNSELWRRTFVDNPGCGIVAGIAAAPPLTPVSILLDFLETMNLDPELKAALDAEYTWQRTPLKPGEDIDVDGDPRVPRESGTLLMEFTSWYWMKTGTCPNWATFMTWIKDFYWRMKDEGIDDIRSDGARALMKASKHIDFAS